MLLHIQIELLNRNKKYKWYTFQNEIIIIKLALILILFTKSVMPKRLTKMLTGIMHKSIH